MSDREEIPDEASAAEVGADKEDGTEISEESRQAIQEGEDYAGRPRSKLSIIKPGILLLLVVAGLSAVVVAQGQVDLRRGRYAYGSLLNGGFWLTFFWVLIGGTFAAASANILNNWVEKDRDAQMNRTRRRPLPAGTIKPLTAFGVAIGLAVIAFLIFWQLVNLAAAILAIGGILFYIFIYTLWLKPRTPQNIVWGGFAGAFPALVGWAAVTTEGGWTIAFLLGLIVFLWTPPHFWALALVMKEDYARAAFPMMPVVKGEESTINQIWWYTLATVALTVFIGIAWLGILYLIAAIALGVPFIRHALKLKQSQDEKAAWALFKYSISYLMFLYFVMMVDSLILFRASIPTLPLI